MKLVFEKGVNFHFVSVDVRNLQVSKTCYLNCQHTYPIELPDLRGDCGVGCSWGKFSVAALMNGIRVNCEVFWSQKSATV